MECPKCQFDNPDVMQFCGKCGSKLANICPECEYVNPTEFQFCGKCGAKIDNAAPATTEPTIPRLEDMHAQLQSMIPDELAQKYTMAEQQATGENRPITALFADISGFTPLSNTQSSETMFQLVQDCFKGLVGVVARYEGSISGFRGDGLLALFGAPILHENDAERAILAATEMRASMLEQGLDVSIGINTAMVTVGEIQTQLHSEYTAYGSDINLAKRLQETAETGQILVGTGTHRLTRRMFDFQAITDLSVKGFQESVTAYSVQQVKDRPEKLRGIEGLRARMIGREHEFADLKESADAWLGGQGQIVSIIGEAGIGKSRLVSELKEYLVSIDGEEESISMLEGRCVSIGQPISYWPFLDILRAYFQLGEGDDEATRASKVTESITNLMPQGADEALPLLGNLLSIKYGNELDDRLKFAGPEQIRHQTLMRLRDLFRVLAEKQPLLLILEDLHWADDLSLDLISLLMDELVNTPLMLLCVYRPEKEHRVWQLGDQARRKCLDRYTELALHPLSSHQSRLLVESLLAIDSLPDSVKSTILAKSEGNPFFIEEVIRSLIEEDVVYREDDHWRARDGIADIHVPDTIQSVVLARVDRLQSEAKYVLQCASVIGRLFKHHLLQHISRQERDLDRHIIEFEDKELIYEERTVPELEYAFKHAFTQEATYEGILEQKRKEFHHQVADGIERLYQERLDEYYEELAYHYSRSADREKAVQYLIRAGDRYRQLYANQNSIRYFNEALALLDELSETNEHESQRLEALEGLGNVHHTIGKHNDAIIYFEKTIALGTKQGITPARLAEFYFKIGYAFYCLERLDKMIETAQAGLAVLGENTLCPQVTLLFENLRHAYLHIGDKAKEVEYASKNAAIVRDLGYFDGIDKVYTGIAWTNGFLKGNVEYSISWTKECMEICERHHDKKGIAFCCITLGDILNFGMNSREAIHWYKKSISIAEDVGYVYGIMRPHVYLGGMFVGLKEDLEEAEEHLKVGADIAKEIGSREYVADAYRSLGEIYLIKQDWDKVIDSMMLMAKILSGLGKITTVELAHILCTLEKTCEKAGRSGEFAHLCDRLMELGELQNTRLTQWYLKPKELSGQFTQTAFSDDFAESALCSEWQWINPRGDCSYELNSEPSWLEIQAVSGCELLRYENNDNLNAPRLVQEISGDFAIETKMASADKETPTAGGLLIWKDKDNFIRFERVMQGTNEIGLFGNIDDNWDHFGRGMLMSDTIYMRIERIGDILSAYCSKDGENWLTCGEMSLPVEDPIQVGIHAISGFAWRDTDTATRFDYFRIMR